MFKALKKKNKTVCVRVHPESDNLFGRKARAYLLSEGKNAHFASALFYMMDVIRSILLYSWRRVDFTIFVRYLMGTAYLPAPFHVVGYNFFALLVPKSEHMFFLDVNPEVANSRIVKSRSSVEMFENLNALKKVRVKALELTRFDEWIIIDSNRSSIDVALALNRNLFLHETLKLNERSSGHKLSPYYYLL
jgi:dTMP kinase